MSHPPPRLSLLALFIALAAPAALAETPYPDDTELAARLERLVAGSKGLAKRSELARSAGGRPIHLLEVAAPGPVEAAKRPAILVVAGLDAAHLVGTDLALFAARHLVERHAAGDALVADLLSRRAVLVVPRANPDGAARFLGRPLTGLSGNDRKLDRDRDGQQGEDGPSDLDGDGVALWMRVRDPKGEWLPDPQEPRLLKKADRAKGEQGIYKLHREGRDADGDGDTAEDPPAGPDPARNFPHRHDLHDDDAGPFASSEPEAKALMDLVIGRPGIGLVLVYGLDDNLVEAPAAGRAEAGKPHTQLHPDDLAYWKAVGEAYRKQTGAKGKPRAVPGGAFFEWAYFHRGLPAFAVRAWHAPPEAPKPPDKKDEKKDGKKEEKKEEKKPEGEPHPDLEWLRLADRLKSGWKDWTKHVHPELGEVEIGGFRPGFRENPPADQVAEIAKREAPFVAHLLSLLPEPRLVEAKATKLADGLFRVSAVVENAGYFPTALAQAATAGEARLVVLDLLGTYQFLGARPEGYRRVLLKSLAGKGGREEVAWLVRSTGPLSVRLRTGTRPEVATEVKLP